MKTTVLLVLYTLLAIPFGAHADLYDHKHSEFESARNKSAKDRFLAMYYLSQCHIVAARYWLGNALAHDPKNVETRELVGRLEDWRKQESMRAFIKAELSGGTDIIEYRYAYSCDPDNYFVLEKLSELRESGILFGSEVVPSKQKMKKK